MRRILVLCFALMYSFDLIAQTCATQMPRTTPDSEFECGDGSSWHSCIPFQDLDDQVRDRRTGLVWQRCPFGMSFDAANGCAGPIDRTDWQTVLLTTTDALPWRAPNVSELQSIIELACYDTSINENVFPNTPIDWYWTSSQTAGFATYAWVVSFSDGMISSDLKSVSHHFRLVRDDDLP